MVKGGRQFGFSALVVVGDRQGRVGFGHSKAREVPEAVRKATVAAKRQLIRVPLREGRTLHHDVVGRFGAGRVVLRAAPPGTGIIAGGAMRAIFECLGIQDVVAKSIGNNNPNNMVHAAFDALSRMESPRMVAQRRDKRVGQILVRRNEESEAASAKDKKDKSNGNKASNGSNGNKASNGSNGNKASNGSNGNKTSNKAKQQPSLQVESKPNGRCKDHTGAAGAESDWAYARPVGNFARPWAWQNWSRA